MRNRWEYQIFRYTFNNRIYQITLCACICLWCILLLWFFLPYQLLTCCLGRICFLNANKSKCFQWDHSIFICRDCPVVLFGDLETYHHYQEIMFFLVCHGILLWKYILCGCHGNLFGNVSKCLVNVVSTCYKLIFAYVPGILWNKYRISPAQVSKEHQMTWLF